VRIVVRVLQLGYFKRDPFSDFRDNLILQSVLILEYCDSVYLKGKS
jgi:hypothetical protein